MESPEPTPPSVPTMGRKPWTALRGWFSRQRESVRDIIVEKTVGGLVTIVVTLALGLILWVVGLLPFMIEMIGLTGDGDDPEKAVTIEERLSPTPASIVPDVVFLSRAEAIAQLDTADLSATVICQESPSPVSISVVYATTPSAFQRVEPGKEITLYINPPCE